MQYKLCITVTSKKEKITEQDLTELQEQLPVAWDWREFGLTKHSLYFWGSGSLRELTTPYEFAQDICFRLWAALRRFMVIKIQIQRLEYVHYDTYTGSETLYRRVFDDK